MTVIEKEKVEKIKSCVSDLQNTLAWAGFAKADDSNPKSVKSVPFPNMSEFEKAQDKYGHALDRLHTNLSNLASDRYEFFGYLPYERYCGVELNELKVVFDLLDNVQSVLELLLSAQGKNRD